MSKTARCARTVRRCVRSFSCVVGRARGVKERVVEVLWKKEVKNKKKISNSIIRNV